MKKYFFLLAAMATLSITFTACSSSSDDNDGAIIILSPYSEFKDEAKTLTFNTMPEISESESIRSIQLSDNGRYLIRIVEDKDEPAVTKTRATSDEVYTYLTGFYHILEKGVSYRLDGFGDITMKVTGSVLNITITLKNGKTIEVGASMTTPGQNHTQATLNICQNWVVTKTRLRLTNKNGLKLGRDFQGCDLPEIKRYIESNSACRVKETFETKAILTNIEFNLDKTFKIYYEDGTDVGSWHWNNESEGTLKYEWEGYEMGNSFEAGNGVFEPKSESTGWLTIDAVIDTDGIDYDVTLTFFLAVDTTLSQELTL